LGPAWSKKTDEHEGEANVETKHEGGLQAVDSKEEHEAFRKVTVSRNARQKIFSRR
jgi:hypothetical protein